VNDPSKEIAIAHPRRFFVESLPPPGREYTLTGDEAHHLLNVVRVRTGEEVTLFDGSGDVVHARLAGAKRGAATLETLSRETVDVEPARALTVACALPRSSRMDFLVEKCAELGVKRLIPVVCKRSVVDPIQRQQNHPRRWNRAVIEAAKQSGRTRLTEVLPAVPFDALQLDFIPGAARMIASPGPDAIPLETFRSGIGPDQPVLALIGPEGGFTDEEVARARCRLHARLPRSGDPARRNRRRRRRGVLVAIAFAQPRRTRRARSLPAEAGKATEDS
jgi:16S rRNA (uracil1498-N3)-methyltransferase